jgi:hypothetical protein
MVALLQMPRETYDDAGVERRIFPRKEVRATVEGRRLDHTIHARQNPRLSLDLRDISLGGLCAISDLPLQSGEKLSVMFPSVPGSSAWGALGRVIRCQLSSMGYRVAVEFDPLPAA